MIFSHLADADKDGLVRENFGDFKIIVFCCLPKSASLCDPITLDMLRLMAINDKKYYALSVNYNTRNFVCRLLTTSIGDIKISGSNDFFVVLRSDSFVQGKPVGMKVYELIYADDKDPDEEFTKVLRLLQGEVTSLNNKQKLREIGSAIFDRILGIFQL